MPALLLSKLAIAELAKVRRPVVTMWINRYRSTALPFPSPVATRDRVEHYAADEVVRWIRARGLGNSDTVVEDLALHAVLGHESALPSDAVLDGVTALLCVKVLLGGQLAEWDAEDLLDEVDGLDPDDRFLFREVERLGDDLEVLAGHVDIMSDAAYTPAEAFEALMRQRFRHGLQDSSDPVLRPAALELAARVAMVLSGTEGAEGAVFVDPSDAGSDLLVTLRSMLPEYTDAVAVTGGADTAASRLADRRLVVHQWRIRSAGKDDGVPGPATFLTQFPGSGAPFLSDMEILSAIDDLVLQMRDGQVAVIVGPASALVDPLADREAESVRSALLRSDRIRAVVRLPEGLLVSRPGLSMALWVLGCADASIAPGDRWTVLADLGGVELDDYTTEAVLSDVLAAMGSWESLRAHSFRVGGVYRTAELLASGTLAPPRPHRGPRPRRPAAEAAGRVVQLVGEYRDRAARIDPHLTVPVEYRSAAAPTVSAGLLARSRELTVVPGNRIDAADLSESGADDAAGVVRVIGPDEVLGRRSVGERGIDRLVFTTRHPNGRYTEPGDIVFCTVPGFGVTVDVEGSSVVLAPARIMRVADPLASGLVPELIAGHLRAVGIGDRTSGAVRRGKPWRTWEIPRVEPSRVPAVTAALADLRRRRQAAEELVATIDRLTDTVVDGVGRGVLVVAEETVSEPEKG